MTHKDCPKNDDAHSQAGRWKRSIERLQAAETLPAVVAALLIAKIILARHLIIGRAVGTGLLADVVFVLAAWALVTSAKGAAYRWLLAALTALASLVTFMLAVYASYFDGLPSGQMLSMAGQVRLGEDIFSLLTPLNVLLLADIPIVSFLAIRAGKGRRRHIRLLRFAAVVSIQMAVVLTVLTAAVGAGQGALFVAHRFGLLAMQTASLVGGSFDVDLDAIAMENDVQAQIDGLTRHDRSQRIPGTPEFGAFAGKSVIMIQMEALQAGVVGAEVGGDPVMPNLDRFIEQSYYFPNTYSQIGRGNTSDAEFVSNTSLLPPPGKPASIAYAKKEIPALPRLLGEMGYETSTFHTNKAEFWNRFQLYPALGFDAYYDREWFGEEDVMGYGPSDRVLYERVLPLLVNTAGEEKPFYANLVTVTAHFPFRWGLKESPLQLPPEEADTVTGRYLRAQAYADAQLGYFLDGLQSFGLLDECVIVIFGDHFGMRWEGETETDAAMRRSLYGHGYNRADFYNVPLVIRVPGQKSGAVHETVLGQVDIMPTIADLLGVDLSDVPHFGRSAFIHTPTLITRPGSLPITIDDELLYVKGIEGKDDRFYASENQEKLAISQPPPEGFGDAMAQLGLCAEYGNGLPERADATDVIGLIPTGGADFR